MHERPPAIRHLSDLPVERWDDPSRGGATWQTLFSDGRSSATGLTTGVCVIPVGEQLAAHRHAMGESYFFLDGTGTQRLGDDTFAVRAGSAVMISPNTIHSTVNTGTQPLRFFYVFAADSFVDVRYEFC